MLALADAYAPFEELGAILDIARLPLDASSVHDQALEGLRTFARRLSPPGSSAAFSIKIDANVAAGTRMISSQQISLREFLGKGYDLDTGAVTLFTYWPNGRSSSLAEGLAHALLDPPYSLDHPDFGTFGSPDYATRERAWMRELLERFCREVLGIELHPDADHGHLEIHRCATDWSSYFDAGHEWWGASLWVLRDHKHHCVTVIGASTTD